jgi:hypothetical protein
MLVPLYSRTRLFWIRKLVLLRCSFTPNSLHYTTLPLPYLTYYPFLPYPTILYLTLPYHLHYHLQPRLSDLVFFVWSHSALA